MMILIIIENQQMILMQLTSTPITCLGEDRCLRGDRFSWAQEDFAGTDLFCVLTGPHLQPLLLSKQPDLLHFRALLRDKGWGEGWAWERRGEADRQADSQAEVDTRIKAQGCQGWMA